MPTCWIIGGPNGAGKTTFAMEYLPNVAGCDRFVNADLIAAGLSPLSPADGLVTASRLFLKEVRGNIEARQDFAFETTLAGRAYLRLIATMRSKGYRVVLTYLALEGVDQSKRRVHERVLHGGHDVPKDVLERRFPRSLRNLFNEYASAVDLCRCFINTKSMPELVFEQAGNTRRVFDESTLNCLMRASRDE